MPERKPEAVIAAIRSATAFFPHMRVAQLISNALDWTFSEGILIGSPSLYYVEDDQLIVALNAYCQQFGHQGDYK